MWNWVQKLLRKGRPIRGTRAAADLVFLERGEADHLLRVREGMPHVDWEAAEAWAMARTSDEREQDRLRRAVAGAWFDALASTLTPDHKRWRHEHVEGVAPMEDGAAQRVAADADRAAAVVCGALRPITGNAGMAPVGVVAIQRRKDYYSFISSFYADDGEFATSGGIYHRRQGWSWPLIVLPVEGSKRALGAVVAHELTHHVLAGLDMPLWAEEGLTQMMEERVTGVSSLHVDLHTRERHEEHWDDEAISRFWSGEAFHFPHGEEQELAYNLAQIVVRGLLTRNPEGFFAFARAAESADGGERAAREHLDVSLQDLAIRTD